MTACVNRKHTKKVAAVVTASLVGALSLGAAPVAAMAATGTGIDLQDIASEQQSWDAATFEWSAERNAYGIYSVDEGDVFALESVTDVYGTTVPVGDYVVVYFDTDGSPVAEEKAIDGQLGGMPEGKGDYTAAVVRTDGEAFDIAETDTIDTLKDKHPVHTVSFTVASEVKTLEGAFAFNGVDKDDVADTTFSYTGNEVSYGFADAEGNVLTDDDCDITWLTGKPGTDAGTFTALLTGKNSYAGSQATVSFTVAKLDLSKADITVDVATSLSFEGVELTTPFKVNGDAIAEDILTATVVSYTDNKGNTVAINEDNAARYLTGTAVGTYQLKVAKADDKNANVTGGVTTATAHIVNQKADVTYDEESVEDYFDDRVFETSKNESFDPSLLAATINDGDDEVPLNVTVTKDGEEVTSYTEPGEYVVTLEVPTPPNCSYGYKDTVKFRVVSKQIDVDDVLVFASIDGKAVEHGVTELPYDGEAMVPSVVVKDGKKVLTAGEDYTVSYRVKGEKDAIDEMVEPGTYEIVVSFPGSLNDDEVIEFDITKATIKSVKPASPVVAYTGETVKPDFVGYTGENGSGTAVELPNSGVGVKYYKAVLNDNDTPTISEDDYYEMPGDDAKDANYVSANNLKDEGFYYAEVTVNSNNDHFQGTQVTYEAFQISKKAGFADVSSSAWYAGAVYQARELGYVNGLSGTNLFAPEADITRADAVCILFNMAGGVVGSNDFQYNENTGYNTGFSDVDGHAYFAKALAWAHASGVANGSNGEFRPYDQITREEFASLLANFAKSKGEYVAADESALDGMSDAASVSDWAKENVAWAVSNKVMGNGGFIAAQDNIIRAEVAAMAVNYQPEAL